ncbi:hypothetical protein LTR86_011309, partial [Recurvomyces mirabilis]
MFNGHSPSAYEHTDDGQVPSNPKSPPHGFHYHEILQGYAPHPMSPPPAALDHEEVVLAKMASRQAVPALLSSPDLSPAKVAELTLQ